MTVSGEQQRDSATYAYVSILTQTPCPPRLPRNIEQSSMWCTVGPCWLSTLNIPTHAIIFDFPKSSTERTRPPKLWKGAREEKQGVNSAEATTQTPGSGRKTEQLTHRQVRRLLHLVSDPGPGQTSWKALQSPGSSHNRELRTEWGRQMTRQCANHSRSECSEGAAAAAVRGHSHCLFFNAHKSAVQTLSRQTKHFQSCRVSSEPPRGLSKTTILISKDCPAGPLVKMPSLQCRGCRFDPSSGN